MAMKPLIMLLAYGALSLIGLFLLGMVLAVLPRFVKAVVRPILQVLLRPFVMLVNALRPAPTLPALPPFDDRLPPMHRADSSR